MTFPLSSHTQPISQTFTMSPPWCYCWLWPLLRLDSPLLSILCVHNIYMYWMYVHVHIHTYQEVSLGTTTGIHAHPSYYSPNDEYHLYYFTTVFRSGWCPFPCAPLPKMANTGRGNALGERLTLPAWDKRDTTNTWTLEKVPRHPTRLARVPLFPSAADFVWHWPLSSCRIIDGCT
jgi:hypothetical protein